MYASARRVAARSASSLRRGVLGLDVDDEADLVAAARAIRLHRRAVRHQQMMRSARRLERAAMAGRVHADAGSRRPSPPTARSTSPSSCTRSSSLRNTMSAYSANQLRDVAVEPAAAVVQRSRQIPVIQRRHRLDAVREQAIDEPLVEVEARRVDATGALRQHAAPRDAEAIGAELAASASGRRRSGSADSGRRRRRRCRRRRCARACARSDARCWDRRHRRAASLRSDTRTSRSPTENLQERRRWPCGSAVYMRTESTASDAPWLR